MAWSEIQNIGFWWGLWKLLDAIWGWLFGATAVAALVRLAAWYRRWQWPPELRGALIALNAITLIVMASLLWSRHSGPLVIPKALQEWGVPPGTCTATVDGRLLSDLKDQYDVVLICGFSDPTVDRVTDRRITVSSPFTIQPEDFPIALPYSTVMQQGVDRAVRQAVQAGLPAFFTVDWYDLAIFPKHTDTSEIRCVQDVSSYGGSIIDSEGEKYAIRPRPSASQP